MSVEVKAEHWSDRIENSSSSFMRVLSEHSERAKDRPLAQVSVETWARFQRLSARTMQKKAMRLEAVVERDVESRGR